MLAEGLTSKECSTKDLGGVFSPACPAPAKKYGSGNRSGALSARTGKIEMGMLCLL